MKPPKQDEQRQFRSNKDLEDPWMVAANLVRIFLIDVKNEIIRPDNGEFFKAIF